MQNLEDSIIFKNFREISKIPHGSGNTKAISDYCVEFAKKYGCKYIQDEANNVVVYLDATKGFENSQPVILQGHLDMVCDKTADCTKDMSREPIDILSDGEYIYADKTTLGGDDGIAIAYMLSVIEDETIEHPPLELLFTTDEEIGMLGANALDTSVLKGKILLNIDSEEEGVLTVSCAGGVRAVCEMPIAFESCKGIEYKITINGLKGGHSGIDIDNRRTNSFKLLAEMLNFIEQEVDFRFVSVEGGKTYNVIPKEVEALICVSNSEKEKFLKAAREFVEMIKTELSQERTMNIEIAERGDCRKCMDSLSSDRLLFTLLQIPNGVQSYNSEIKDMVQTSLNWGVIETNNDCVKMNALIRGNSAFGKQKVVHKVKSFAQYLGGKVEYYSDYPAWEYKSDSRLREVMVDVYTEMYGKQPLVTGIHAGLECGILSGKIKDMDAVSFGPNIFNIHTPKEKLEIRSALRTWEYIKAVLRKH